MKDWIITGTARPDAEPFEVQPVPGLWFGVSKKQVHVLHEASGTEATYFRIDKRDLKRLLRDAHALPHVQAFDWRGKHPARKDAPAVGPGAAIFHARVQSAAAAWQALDDLFTKA